MAIYKLENVVLIHETKDASLFRMTYLTEEEIPDEFEDDIDQWWIPHSQIESSDIDEIGGQGTVEVPLWMAKQKNMHGADD